MSSDERLAELEQWTDAMSRPGFARDLQRQVHNFLAVEWARNDFRKRRLEERLDGAKERIELLESELNAARDEIETVGGKRDALETELVQARKEITLITGNLHNEQVRSARLADRIKTLDARAQRLQSQLDSVRSSRWWRLRGVLLKIPGVAWLARTAGRARSR